MRYPPSASAGFLIALGAVVLTAPIWTPVFGGMPWVPEGYLIAVVLGWSYVLTGTIAAGLCSVSVADERQFARYTLGGALSMIPVLVILLGSGLVLDGTYGEVRNGLLAGTAFIALPLALALPVGVTHKLGQRRKLVGSILIWPVSWACAVTALAIGESGGWMLMMVFGLVTVAIPLSIFCVPIYITGRFVASRGDSMGETRSRTHARSGQR